MEQPAVTIPLKDYNDLRDRAQLNQVLLDKITFFESRMMFLENSMRDLEARSNTSGISR